MVATGGVGTMDLPAGLAEQGRLGRSCNSQCWQLIRFRSWVVGVARTMVQGRFEVTLGHVGL